MSKIFKVKCPQCEIEFSYYESESRPFCSERCKLIDLGHWFQESYRVPEKKMEIGDIREENTESEIHNEEKFEDYGEEDYNEEDYN